MAPGIGANAEGVVFSVTIYVSARYVCGIFFFDNFELFT